MVQAQFLREISRVLKGSGILRLVTDDPNYLQAIETHAADLLSLPTGVGKRARIPADRISDEISRGFPALLQFTLETL